MVINVIRFLITVLICQVVTFQSAVRVRYGCSK